MQKIKLIDKAAIGAVVVIIITNPASSQFILNGLDWLFQQIFNHGSPLNFAASGVLVVYIFYKVWVSREKTIIPSQRLTSQRLSHPKTKKTQPYIAT